MTGSTGTTGTTGATGATGATGGLPSNILVVAGTDFSCATSTADSQVICWGNGVYGQLGDGSVDSSSTPVTVSGGLSNVIALAAGIEHVCALTGAGEVYCWGDNLDNALGPNAVGMDSSAVPVSVSGWPASERAIDIKSNNSNAYTCVLTNAGHVYCWGTDSEGELGDEGPTSSAAPLQVGSAGGSINLTSSICAGDLWACSTDSNGNLDCWGMNVFGDFGNGTTEPSNPGYPTQTPVTPVGFQSLACGANHICGLNFNGGVDCWGWNFDGESGNGAPSSTLLTSPNAVPLLSEGIADIEAGAYHTCAITYGGRLLCWGENTAGQVGNGTDVEQDVPAEVVGLAGRVVAVAGGSQHTCAATSGGNIYCWGANGNGQLGPALEVGTGSLVPVQVQ